MMIDKATFLTLVALGRRLSMSLGTGFLFSSPPAHFLSEKTRHFFPLYVSVFRVL